MATVYVSNTAVNGIPVGDDTSGTGAIGAPWLTFQRGLAIASSGDILMVNDGTYRAPSNWFSIAKSLDIRGVTDYGAVIKSNVTPPGLVLFIGTAGITVSIGKIIIDGGGTNGNGIQVADLASTVTLNLLATKIQNCTGHHVTAPGTANKLALTSTGTIIENLSSVSKSGYFIFGLVAGSVNISGGSITLSKANTSTFGGVTVLARAASLSASVSNIPISITIDSAATTSAMHYGVQIYNIPNALIDGVDLTMDANGTARTGTGLWISANTASPAYDASGGIIRNCTVRPWMPDGISILIGQNGSNAFADGQSNNGTIHDNTVIGNAVSEPLMHGIMFGWNSGGVGCRNKVSRTNIGLLAKGTTVATNYYSNVVYKIIGTPLYAKGAAGVTFANNASYNPTGYASSNTILIGPDPTTSTNSTGAIVNNNIVQADVTPSFAVFVGASDDATFANNNYCIPAPLWGYNGVNVSTLAAWQAAHEPSAQSVNANFRDAPNGDLYPRSPRLARGGVAVAGVTTDYAGQAFLSPPSVGAYQSRSTYRRGEAVTP